MELSRRLMRYVGPKRSLQYCWASDAVEFPVILSSPSNLSSGSVGGGELGLLSLADPGTRRDSQAVWAAPGKNSFVEKTRKRTNSANDTGTNRRLKRGNCNDLKVIIADASLQGATRSSGTCLAQYLSTQPLLLFKGLRVHVGRLCNKRCKELFLAHVKWGECHCLTWS